MAQIKPSITLYEIFGPGYIYNPRASYKNKRWLPDLISQHSTTGSLLLLAGEMPIVCHQNVTEPSCLAFFEEKGLKIANNRYIYHNQNSYYEVLHKFQLASDKVVINYPHLPEELNYGKYWVQPKLLSYLNNKGNLEELVPKENLAKRKVMPITHFLNSKNFLFDLPFVVKAATDEPAGAGLDVVICRNEGQLLEAKELFKSCKFVVIEEFIPIKQNYCIQFAQTHKGSLIYLGAAEQIITEEGKYGGNWIERANQLPKKVIELAEMIMKKSISMGYWGIAGIDIVIGEDERVLVIDLNFRQNGSTGALLLKESIMNALNVQTLKLRSFKTTIDFTKVEKEIRRLMELKKLVPLSIYKPAEVTTENPIILSCLLAGNSKEEVITAEQQAERFFKV